MIDRSLAPWDPARDGWPARSTPLPGRAESWVAEAAGPRHLREWLWVLYRYRLMVATIFGTCVALAILLSFFMPRQYTAVARLQVSRRSPIQLRLQDNVLQVEDGERDRDGLLTFLATQGAVLRSRDLAERVIRERGLAEGGGLLQAGARLAGAGSVAEFLRPRGWDEVASAGDGPRPGAGQAAPPAEVDRYVKALAVREVRGTDLIDLSFTTASPTLSAFLAAAHTQAYIDANEEARRQTEGLARGFLDRQVAESQERLVRAEAALGRFAATHPRVAANEEQKIAGQQITALSSSLSKAEAARLALQSRYRFLARPETQTLAYFLDEPAIQKLRLSLLDVQAQRSSVSHRLGPNHPQMIDLRHVETEIGRQLDAEVRQQVTAVRMRYDAARVREERLRRRLAREERWAGKLRELGAHYSLLKGEVDTTHALHASLRKQRIDTAVNAELVPTNVRVIERPEVPQRPSRPNVPLYLTIGVAAGLVLAFGAAFARDYFDDTVKSDDDMEELLRVPTLATIPSFAPGARRGTPVTLATVRSLIGRGPDAQASVDRPEESDGTRSNELVVVHAPWSGVAEAFRSMRTAVLFSAPDEPPRVTLVTSTLAGEGKTVASLNLALALAQSGAQVILVDADLRHPRCHAVLGVPNDSGLSNVLLGEVPLASAVRTIDDPPLTLLPAGPPPSNPSELVGSIRMHDLLAELRQGYDFVIVDTPPVLAVTDAVLLARQADGVILVVKGDATPRELVRHARDRLGHAGARFLGVVMNNVNVERSNVYYGYLRYRYGHPYGNGTPHVSEAP